jgi:hypothetical protein
MGMEYILCHVRKVTGKGKEDERDKDSTENLKIEEEK